MQTKICRELYSTPPRLYHSWDHAVSVASMASVLGKIHCLDEDTQNDLWLAGLWHDSIYVVGDSENEENSAKEFLKHYPDKEHVVEWIRGTTIANHLSSDPVSIEQACLLDADLSPLALDNKVFLKNCLNICIEQNCSIRNQAIFLSRFLDKERIYRTDVLHETFEELARQNIMDLLKETK